MEYVMHKICAKCGKDMGTILCVEERNGMTTTGMCDACGPKWHKEQMEDIENEIA